MKNPERTARKTIPGDLHTHTTLCHHAEGRPEEYLLAAQKEGLSFLGVSDHAPWPACDEWRMNPDEFPRYRDIVSDLRLKAADSGVEILYGAEMDYIPGQMDEARRILQETEPLDYLIGSIHHVDGFPFDDPARTGEWETIGPDRIWERYAELLLDFVEKERFQILGHPDLPKKFGIYPADPHRFLRKMNEVFEAASARGIALELNTAGLRYPVGEIYPAPLLLKAAFQAGMKLTFGSDAHKPDQIACGFQKALDAALAAGYRSTVVFRRRQALELPLF